MCPGPYLELVQHLELGEDVVEEGAHHGEGGAVVQRDQRRQQVQVLRSEDSGRVLDSGW